MSHRAESRARGRRLPLTVLAVFLLLLALLVGCAGTGAKPPASAAAAAGKELPSGEELLSWMVKAAGGEKANRAIESRVTYGRLSISTVGITAPMTTYARRPNELYLRSDIPGIGAIVTGIHDGVVWEINPVMGPAVKDGEERAFLLRHNHLDGFAAWRDFYTDAACTGLDTIAGLPCYVLEMTPAVGHKETHYVDTKEHLLRKTSLILGTSMGEIPMEAYSSDYRRVDGVLVPFASKEVLMGGMQTMEMTTDSLKHNVALPDSIFALPADIQALVEKAKAGTK